MSDLAEATGVRSIYRLEVNGDVYEITPLKMRTAGKLQTWLNSQPGPRAVEKAREVVEGMPEDVAKEILRDAALQDRAWPPQVHFDPGHATLAFMNTEKGTEELMYQILKQASLPGTDDRKLREVAGSLDRSEYLKVVGAAFGNQEEVLVDRARPELITMTRDDLNRFAQQVIVAAGTGEGEAPELEDVVPIVDAVGPSNFGMVVRLNVVGESVSVPKAEVGGKSRRSISVKPTPS